MVIYPLSPQGPLQDIKHRISVASTSFTNVNYHVLCLCHDMGKKWHFPFAKISTSCFFVIGFPENVKPSGLGGSASTSILLSTPNLVD